MAILVHLRYGHGGNLGESGVTESGSNKKYAIVGLILLLGAGLLVWLALPKQPPPPVEEPKVKTIERSTTMEPTIEIPEAVPDASLPEEQPKVRVRYVRSSWECSGNIEQAAAKAVIRKNSRQVRSCYERQLRSNNLLEGKLMLHMRVDNKGRVTATNIGGSLNDKDVTACVRRVAQSWSFPAPKGGSCAVVAAPFNLTPKS